METLWSCLRGNLVNNCDNVIKYKREHARKGKEGRVGLLIASNPAGPLHLIECNGTTHYIPYWKPLFLLLSTFYQHDIPPSFCLYPQSWQ